MWSVFITKQLLFCFLCCCWVVGLCEKGRNKMKKRGEKVVGAHNSTDVLLVHTTKIIRSLSSWGMFTTNENMVFVGLSKVFAMLNSTSEFKNFEIQQPD